MVFAVIVLATSMNFRLSSRKSHRTRLVGLNRLMIFVLLFVFDVYLVCATDIFLSSHARREDLA